MFSKKDTAILKGIAILAMVLHHVCQVNPGLPLNEYEVFSPEDLLAASGKVCVSLLTLLSGFGLAEGFARQRKRTLSFALRFTLSHILQLLSIYWCFLVFRHTYFWFTVGSSLSDFYGFGWTGAAHALADLTGAGFFIGTPTASGDWYLQAVFIFYALFPLLFFLLEKGKTAGKVLLLIASYVPWIVYLIRNDVDMETDNALFYLFSFIMGIILSQTGFLAAQKRMGFSRRGILFSLAFLVSAFGLRAYVTMPADPLLAFALVELEIFVLSKTPCLRGLLSSCGKQSANIWLIHPLVLVMLGSGFMTKWMNWITAVFLCVGISMVTEAIRQGTGFNSLIRRARNLLLPPESSDQSPKET